MNQPIGVEKTRQIKIDEIINKSLILGCDMSTSLF